MNKLFDFKTRGARVVLNVLWTVLILAVLVAVALFLGSVVAPVTGNGFTATISLFAGMIAGLGVLMVWMR